MNITSLFNRILFKKETLGHKLVTAMLAYEEESSQTVWQLRRVQALIDGGADLSVFSDGWKRTDTPLMIAVRRQRFKAVDMMLKSPGTQKMINYVNPSEESALYFAAAGRMTDVVKKLLEAGADPNVGTLHPLHAAFTAKNCETIRLLLAAKADVNTLTNTSYLIMAASDKSLHKLVPELIAAKSDLEKKNDEGQTALHWAVRCDQVENVAALIEAGADINAVDNNGDIPLPYACNYAMINTLMAAGADILHINKEGLKIHEVAAEIGAVLLEPDTIADALEARYDKALLALEEKKKAEAARLLENQKRLDNALVHGLPLEKEIVLDAKPLVFRKKTRPAGTP